MELMDIPSESLMQAWGRIEARRFNLAQLSDDLIVKWNSRLQTTAGRAFCHSNVIELNPRLVECGKDEVWRTLKHELAHLMVSNRYGRKRVAAHGPEWLLACAELGIPDEKVRHSLPFPRRVIEKKHVYECPSCLVEIRRVRAIRRRVACFACCRTYAGGRYEERFRLAKKKLSL